MIIPTSTTSTPDLTQHTKKKSSMESARILFFTTDLPDVLSGGQSAGSTPTWAELSLALMHLSTTPNKDAFAVFSIIRDATAALDTFVKLGTGLQVVDENAVQKTLPVWEGRLSGTRVKCFVIENDDPKLKLNAINISETLLTGKNLSTAQPTTRQSSTVQSPIETIAHLWGTSSTAAWTLKSSADQESGATTAKFFYSVSPEVSPSGAAETSNRTNELSNVAHRIYLGGAYREIDPWRIPFGIRPPSPAKDSRNAITGQLLHESTPRKHARKMLIDALQLGYSLQKPVIAIPAKDIASATSLKNKLILCTRPAKIENVDCTTKHPEPRNSDTKDTSPEYPIEQSCDAMLYAMKDDPTDILRNMRAGCVPIVPSINPVCLELADYCRRYGTGNAIIFNECDSTIEILNRVAALFSCPTSWSRLQQNCITKESSWEKSATKLLAIYNSAFPIMPDDTHESDDKK